MGCLLEKDGSAGENTDFSQKQEVKGDHLLPANQLIPVFASIVIKFCMFFIFSEHSYVHACL